MTMTTRGASQKAQAATSGLKPPPPPPKQPSPNTGAVPPSHAENADTDGRLDSRPTGQPVQHLKTPPTVPGKELKQIPDQPPMTLPANPTPVNEDVETTPEGDRKPAAVETPSPTQPEIGGRIPWSEMAPQTTPNSYSSSVEYSNKPNFNWKIDDEELNLVQANTLNMRFLTTKIPQGLGLSNSCKVWLDALNIHHWEDLISFAPYIDVQIVMKELTVQTYHKYCSDIRKIICFGKLCKSMRPETPRLRRRRHWLQKYKNILSSNLRSFPAIEERCAEFLWNQQQQQMVGQPVVQNHTHTQPTQGVPQEARIINMTGITSPVDGGILNGKFFNLV